MLRFENHAPRRGEWRIGDGIADTLVHALVDTGRYVVIERRELGSVFRVGHSLHPFTPRPPDYVIQAMARAGRGCRGQRSLCDSCAVP